MSADTELDFSAILAEETSQDIPADVLSTGSAYATKDELLEDLLNDIEQQEIESLHMEDVIVAGVQNDKQADILLARYNRLSQRAADINEVANKAITSYREKVENWRSRELTGLNSSMSYISNLLEAYARVVLANSKRKSRSLPEGTFGFTKQQPKYDTNDDKLREFISGLNLDDKTRSKFLEKLPDKVKWGEFKKAGKLDKDGIFRYGEVAVPGVVVTMRPDKFSVKN